MSHLTNMETDYLAVLLNPDQNDETQIEKSVEYVLYNFMDISLKDGFLQLNWEYFSRLIEHDNLNVHSEEIVFRCVKRWLEFKQLNVTTDMHLLIQLVRLPLLSAEYLMSDVEPYTFSSSKSRPYFIEALRYHLFPNQRSIMSSPRTKPRKSFSKFLAVGSWNINTSNVIEIYDASLNSWTQLNKLDIKKEHFGAAIVENSLLIIGGYNNASLPTVESVNLMDGSISTIASLQDARYNFGVAVIGEGRSAIVYVVGGCGESKVLKTVERWDPINRKWSYVMPMLESRDSCGVARIGNKIYVAGGRHGDTFHNSLEVYDINADRWEMKALMNRTRSYCRATAAGGYIYAAGGYLGPYDASSRLVHVERYDPRINTWTMIASVSIGGVVGLASLRNNPICVGGVSASNVVEEYDPKKNVWKRLAPIGVGREGVCVVEIPWITKPEHKYINHDIR